MRSVPEKEAIVDPVWFLTFMNERQLVVTEQKRSAAGSGLLSEPDKHNGIFAPFILRGTFVRSIKSHANVWGPETIKCFIYSQAKLKIYSKSDMESSILVCTVTKLMKLQTRKKKWKSIPRLSPKVTIIWYKVTKCCLTPSSRYVTESNRTVLKHLPYVSSKLVISSLCLIYWLVVHSLWGSPDSQSSF